MAFVVTANATPTISFIYFEKYSEKYSKNTIPRKEKFTTICGLISYRTIQLYNNTRWQILMFCKLFGKNIGNFSKLSFAHNTRVHVRVCVYEVDAHVYNLSPHTSRTVSSFSFFVTHPRWLRPRFSPLKQYRPVDQSFTNREINLSCFSEIQGKE